MAKYKVSYKVLSKEAEELKAVAKLLDGYAQQVSQIQGRLGQTETLAAVRSNLQKLSAQLGESRAVLSTAGQILAKSVGSYTAAETRQVKKVDNLKAHNRDFYKNPVVVASVGGAAAVPPTAGVTINATTVNYTAAPEPAAAPAVNSAAAGPGTGSADMAGAGGLGAMAGAGAAMGALRLKKQREEEAAEKTGVPAADTPEAQLEKALERMRLLEKQGSRGT
ncbi:hypothetical protein [Sporomusa sphaeroides]|uniref:Uncharacterized protein n=2 Tax=Sporomusa TaxID=2375 RepID=A0ABM9W0M8_9FIRM|nr:hypothetical protein [Sporomusa sphaeroides]OLS56766.1 hypothetical protein SPSPH_02560 [Sporomusa sphaeroides DSM 2875]CVK18713.1 hypothetical protein SSPH_01357 [Sporomusa sphaeroides DSM 2875]SCM81971.1 hypothetical protein KL86SPO_40456 [uncultured Sporomusa sp.]